MSETIGQRGWVRDNMSEMVDHRRHALSCTAISTSLCVTRSLFQFSRRERELLSFDLVFETRTRISFYHSRASRREREFLSLNLVLRDENENFIFQSRASRRERESRLRQFSREFSGITFIACLMTYIFQKKAVIF